MIRAEISRSARSASARRAMSWRDTSSSSMSRAFDSATAACWAIARSSSPSAGPNASGRRALALRTPRTSPSAMSGAAATERMPASRHVRVRLGHVREALVGQVVGGDHGAPGGDGQRVHPDVRLDGHVGLGARRAISGVPGHVRLAQEAVRAHEVELGTIGVEQADGALDDVLEQVVRARGSSSAGRPARAACARRRPGGRPRPATGRARR